MFLPVSAAIQYSVQGEKDGGTGEVGREKMLQGFRAAEWFCFALAGVSLVMGVVGLRNIGKIGLLKKLGNVQGVGREEDEEEK